ncbi:MAG: hypothetical protein CSA36_02940 [Draconibacterium sp.]|nr:MAG: hypothetical protein CSA36_02940 [Draconibacterium sp.]
MIEIGKTIISRDIFEEHFVCDLIKCKGACCIEGDSGAPLTEEEAASIAKNYASVSIYIPENQKKEIKKQGFSIIDSDGDRVTPLINNRQCVYSFTDKHGVLNCAIEKAFLNGEAKFRKPISCHLFPIRVKIYTHFEAVNYQELKICSPGKICGAKSKTPLYRFLKEPLIRKYGKEWYEEVELAAAYLKNENKDGQSEK